MAGTKATYAALSCPTAIHTPNSGRLRLKPVSRRPHSLYSRGRDREPGTAVLPEEWLCHHHLWCKRRPIKPPTRRLVSMFLAISND